METLMENSKMQKEKGSPPIMIERRVMKQSGSLLGVRSKIKSLPGSRRRTPRAVKKPFSLPNSRRVTACAQLPWKISKRRWPTVRWRMRTLKPSLVRCKESLVA